MKKNAGLTLIELVFVVALIALISAFVVVRFDALLLWKASSDMRQFANTWQFLFNEAYGRGNAYRLIINLDDNYYMVRREVPVVGTSFTQVDYLANFRAKIEKGKKASTQEDDDELLSLDKELAEEDARLGGPLDESYYQVLFADPHSPKRLAVPVEFPSLAERKLFSEGLSFRDVVLSGAVSETGRVSLILSPRAAPEFAVVHLKAGQQIFSIFINPATGRVSTLSGDWKLEDLFNLLS